MVDKWSLPQMDKVPIFKPQVSKVFLEQTTSRQSVIFPY